MDRSTNKFDPATKIWSGPSLPSSEAHLHLGHHLIRALSACPEMIGQISHEDGHEMKNKEILRNSVRLALSLRDLGLEEGDVVSIAAGNSRYLSAVVFGAIFDGIAANTLDPNYKSGDLVHSLGITEPKLVFCDEVNLIEVLQALREMKREVPVYVMETERSGDTSYKSILDLLNAHPEEESYEPPQLSTPPDRLPALILYSSGTTGRPKAIPIPHAAIPDCFRCQRFLTSRSLLSFSSLFWGSGVLILFRGTLDNKTRVIVNHPFEPKLCLEMIRAHQLEFVFLTPTHLHILLQGEDYDLESNFQFLKCLATGGAAAPDPSRLSIPLDNWYALTESNLSGCINGNLNAGVQVKIVNEEDKEVGPGETGEVLLRPVVPFLGYCRNQEATEKMLKDGFLRTGDLGMIDEKGFLRIINRKKDIFKYSGFQINPTDIEERLESISGVLLVCVFGIPDPIYDTLPGAAIIREEGSNLSESDVHKFAKEFLPQFKWLRGGVYFFDQFPLTASGKIQRKQVGERALEIYKQKGGIGFDY